LASGAIIPIAAIGNKIDLNWLLTGKRVDSYEWICWEFKEFLILKFQIISQRPTGFLKEGMTSAQPYPSEHQGSLPRLSTIITFPDLKMKEVVKLRSPF
jgi:hypothetical protein